MIKSVAAAKALLVNNLRLGGQSIKITSYRPIRGEILSRNSSDGRGASSYVSGFLDAISTEKNILCLGQIPHLTSSAHIQLASLQEMVEQPLLKKRLWQFMQNKIKE